MARMNWKDGWHSATWFDYYIENGLFVRGLLHNGISSISNNGKTVYPYVESKDGGYDRVYDMKANKRNFSKIYWF